MATSNNNILNLPFDEPNGSAFAYDYSPSRTDGVVKGAEFVSGKVGNAIQFNGADTCEITASQLNLNSNFTLLGWVKGTEIECGSPQQLIWLLNFDEGETYEEITLDYSPGIWRNTALVRRGTTYTIYQNNKKVEMIVNSGKLCGVSLSQDYYGGEYGKGCVDDLKIYNVAFSEEELNQAFTSTKTLNYYIDGQNFKDFGVYVSESDGLLDRPKIKKPATFEWDNYHGEAVDFQHVYYEAREITLNCFIKASGKVDFASKLVRFQQLFDKRGTLRLMVDIHPTKPLVYEVYCEESINVKKEWNESSMTGTFTLQLREPDPVKRVLKHIVTSDSTSECSITLTTNKLVNIYWGDGEADLDIYEKEDTYTKTHPYKEKGEYYPVITGCIDEIKDFSTNAIVVWNKL